MNRKFFVEQFKPVYDDLWNIINLELVPYGNTNRAHTTTDSITSSTNDSTTDSTTDSITDSTTDSITDSITDSTTDSTTDIKK